jgi:hypothetical protein
LRIIDPLLGMEHPFNSSIALEWGRALSLQATNIRKVPRTRENEEKLYQKSGRNIARIIHEGKELVDFP